MDPPHSGRMHGTRTRAFMTVALHGTRRSGVVGASRRHGSGHRSPRAYIAARRRTGEATIPASSS